MNAPPPVSIGLPVRNGDRYLELAISDLLAQTAGDFELLISDNASDDGTEEIGRAATRDRRVSYVRQSTNIGAAANYNLVFRRTAAPFFRWASHDDRCAPTHLQACLERYESSGPDLVLVYPATMLIDEDGDEIGPYDDNFELSEASARARLVHLARNWNLCNPVMGLMRRSAAERTRLIDTFRTSDLVFLAELALAGTVAEVPETLFLRRIHSGSALQGEGTEASTWLDPNARRRSQLVERSTLPVLGEILRSVHRHPASAAERAEIEVAVSAAWLARRLRVNGGRAKLWLRGLARKTP